MHNTRTSSSKIVRLTEMVLREMQESMTAAAPQIEPAMPLHYREMVCCITKKEVWKRENHVYVAKLKQHRAEKKCQEELIVPMQHREENIASGDHAAQSDRFT